MAAKAFGVSFLLLLVAAACGPSEDTRGPVELDLAAVRSLVNAATEDAQTMERHADAMAAATALRPDRARWMSEVETVRANARSLRFLADAARAIVRDQETFPVTATTLDLGRLLGHGLNLLALGDTLIKHVEAMEAHVRVMRDEAAHDLRLSSSIEDLATDAGRMKADGQTAREQGQALAQRARDIARSIGAKIE